MVGPGDLRQLLDYLRERQRRHNRALHGWGVVYGALVLPADGNQVRVTPGLLLTPQGDEIEIPSDSVLDPTQLTAGGDDDPWHSTVTLDKGTPPKDPVYLAVRYLEVPSRPVRVPPVSCGFDDEPCRYTRLCDSYEFGLLDRLPASHAGDQPGPSLAGVVVGALKTGSDDQKAQALLATVIGPTLPDVPAEIADPWVVLAALQLSSNAAPVIDPVSPRRLVVSLAPAWWRPLPAIDRVDRQASEPGKATLLVTGKNLFPLKPTDVTFSGSGASAIKAESIKPDAKAFGQSLTVRVSFTAGQGTGPRTLTVKNSGRATATKDNVVVEG
jgi:hypothetical protein